MTFPADLTKINNQLAGALSFMQTYTRDTFPLFFSTQYLAPNAFHNVAGRLGYFPANMATSEAASILGVAFFKAYTATGTEGYKTLGLAVTDAFAGHFFLDDIYTTTNQGLNTPLVRNHWLVIAYGSVTTEGDQNSNDPFNFGTYASYTFTNGVAQLPSDLSKFYKAYSGELHYQNIFAPLRSGTEYPYDYYVRQGYKIDSNGTQTATAEPDGKVVLQDTGFSGTLDCVFVRLNGSTLTAGGAVLTGANMAEPYPLFFKCKEGSREYTSTATDTVWWSYEMFDRAYAVTSDSKYSNAREITKYNAIQYIVNRKVETYYLRKEVSDNPLRYPGSYSLQYAVDSDGNTQPPPGYTISRETSGVVNEFIRLDINANSNPNVFSGVELQNFVSQTFIDPLVTISIEAASTVDQVLEIKVSLSPDALNLTEEYKAYWKITGNSTIQSKTLTYTAFMQYPTSNVWNIASAENPVFVYNSATYDLIQDIPLGIDTVVVSMTMPTASDGGGLINANYSNFIPDIVYNLSGNATIRFQDDSSNYYYVDIADTGGSWLTFTSSWAQLGVSDRILTEIVFQNIDNSNPATIKLFYVGDPANTIPAPTTSYKAAITDRDRAAHTLWVGDFKPNNNPLDNKKYKPGVIDFVLNTLNSAESGFYGEQYYCGYQSAYVLDKWGLTNEAQNVLQLWTDAQESYRNQSTSKLEGLLHQVFLPYSPENIPYLEKLTVPRKTIGFPIPMFLQGFTEVPTDSYQFNSFSWKGLDPNTQWVNYNNRAMEDLARYFHAHPEDSKARKILVNYINFIYDYYQTNPTTVLTDIPPNVDPQANYSEPHAAAIEGLTALFANLGGMELDKTFWLMQNRFNYIDNQYVSTGAMTGSWTAGQPTFDEGGITYRENFSFWHGKCIEYYSELVIYQNVIRQSITTTRPVYPSIGSCNNYAHFISEIVEPEYPTLDQKYLAGNKQRILLSDSPVGKKIKLRYESLDTTSTESLITFYNTTNQQYDGQFTFNANQVSYNDFAGTWVFEQPPTVNTKIANKDRAVFDIEIAIKRVL